MLRNFLDALDITGAPRKLKRVVLTTGAKQHAVHLGAPKNPMEESDPWIEGPDRPPNFYYYQQRILAEKAKASKYDWVVTYPNDVIGVAKGNFMNLATSLGMYASVSKELDGTLVFPGSELFYQYFDCFTYSRLHASFNLWAALEQKASNQAFNVMNGDTESWQNRCQRLQGDLTARSRPINALSKWARIRAARCRWHQSLLLPKWPGSEDSRVEWGKAR